jgi:hypothetical protein
MDVRKFFFIIEVKNSLYLCAGKIVIVLYAQIKLKFLF